MMKVALFSVSLMFLAACGDSEPVATSYKNSMTAASAPAPATGTGTTTGTGDAALKAQGTTLYNSKCAPCHSPLATSQKKGATAARITAAATISSHSSVTPYPTASEASALEAALK